jgi:hypothetical protein
MAIPLKDWSSEDQDPETLWIGFPHKSGKREIYTAIPILLPPSTEEPQELPNPSAPAT